jgi:hypothetical protein
MVVGYSGGDLLLYDFPGHLESRVPLSRVIEENLPLLGDRLLLLVDKG